VRDAFLVDLSRALVELQIDHDVLSPFVWPLLL
jgi:hypothetical protein